MAGMLECCSGHGNRTRIGGNLRVTRRCVPAPCDGDMPRLSNASG